MVPSMISFLDLVWLELGIIDLLKRDTPRVVGVRRRLGHESTGDPAPDCAPDQP